MQTIYLTMCKNRLPYENSMFSLPGGKIQTKCKEKEIHDKELNKHTKGHLNLYLEAKKISQSGGKYMLLTKWLFVLKTRILKVDAFKVVITMLTLIILKLTNIIKCLKCVCCRQLCRLIKLYTLTWNILCLTSKLKRKTPS